MSKAGYPYDNAPMERYFNTLKNDLIYQHYYRTEDELYTAGFPYTAASMQVKGDPITDLHESMAAEQKARTTYDNILRFCDDYDVKDPIRFLRAREVVHYQRFGENLRLLTDKLNEKNFYACGKIPVVWSTK